MEYRSGLVLAVSFAFVAAVSASAACSSSSSTPAPAAAGDGSVVVNASVCKTTGNYESCFLCCSPPVAYLTAQDAFNNCLCTGPCKAQCGASAACLADGGGPDPTPDCQTCLENDANGTSCAPAAEAVCNADADCARFAACRDQACDALPDADGGH